jgi:uncharacterized lipoprotein YddW (UPF0748 family)
MFVTTANNIDWPSQAGLHALVQQNEIDAIVNRAKEMNCNTIFLQVRAYGDRMYTTTAINEPWSLALNWTHDPGYEPLGVWIRKCHDQGIQLHAWINPFRTDWPIIPPGQTTPLPFYASDDGEHLYLDPTSQAVQDYLINTVLTDLLSYRVPATVMNAYMMAGGQTAATPSSQPGDDDGVDGIVLDHYFPDPGSGGGASADVRLASADNSGAAALAAAKSKPAVAMVKKPPTPRIKWLLKKHNVPDPYPAKQEKTLDDFIKRAFELTDGKEAIFSISPSADQYDAPSANAKKWLQQGWCHYFIPELYLAPADFNASLDKWIADNVPADPTATRKPVIVAGLFTAGVERPDASGKLWPAKDIEDEIDYAQSKKIGQAHYSFHATKKHEHGGPPDDHNVGEHVRGNQYKNPTVPPAVGKPPTTPVPDPTITKTIIAWKLNENGKPVKSWIVRLKDNGTWGPPMTLPKKQDKVNKGTHERIAVIAVYAQGIKSKIVEAGP